MQYPPRAEYLLTKKGKELRPVLKTLFDWGKRHTRHPWHGQAGLTQSRRTPTTLRRASSLIWQSGDITIGCLQRMSAQDRNVTLRAK